MQITRKQKLVFLNVILIIFLFAWVTYRYFSIERNGFVGVGTVQVGDERYNYTSFSFTEEGKVIAKIDTWSIMEIPEDSEHNFLAIRSFLDNDLLVKEGYVIPEDGEISCVYASTHRRSDDEKLLDVIEKIIACDYGAGFEIKDCGCFCCYLFYIMLSYF